MNDHHEHRQTPESIDGQIERLKIRKLRKETQPMEAGMRHYRFRLALDIVKWSVITMAVVVVTVAARHAGILRGRHRGSHTTIARPAFDPTLRTRPLAEPPT